MTVFLSSFEDILDDYDTFIIDLWGVVHNGYALYAGIEDFFASLKKAQKIVLLLSNAPRRKAPVQEQLKTLGLDTTFYTDLYTSGEDVHQTLKARQSHQKCFSFMISDADLLSDSEITLVTSLEEADFFLNATMPSLPNDLVQHTLEKAFTLDLLMVCVNPDVSVISGGDIRFCAGSLAERYEAIGGKVSYHGKPHPAVYQALQSRHQFDKTRTLGIGDALKTDILGAQNFGIDSMLVLTGLEGRALGLQPGGFPDFEGFRDTCEARKIIPTYVLAHF